MNAHDLVALSPLVVTAATAVAVLVVLSCRRHHAAAAWTAAVGLAAAAATLPVAARGAPREVTTLLTVDGAALFYWGLLLAAAFAVTLLAYGYLKRLDGRREELYALVPLATLGSMVLAASSHFASFFLGLETLSVALYTLIGYRRKESRDVEAALKYLVLAGAASAFLVFGIALLYAELGTLELGAIAERLASTVPTPWVVPALVLVITGVGFKLALVPFHMWTPDVYDGAPAPVTAFIATVSKGGMVALLVRYSSALDLSRYGALVAVLAGIAGASMLAGNLLALLQERVKRILAYSSIAHFGYLLVALLAAGELARGAIAFYLVAYFVTTLGAFGVVTVLSTPDGEAGHVEDYRGLFWRRPALATLLAACLFSLAGIPLTGGFVGKLYVLAAGVEGARWTLVLLLVAGSVVGLFYYLRIVVTMAGETPAAEPLRQRPPGASLAAAAALSALFLLLLWLGVYPAPWIGWIARWTAGV